MEATVAAGARAAGGGGGGVDGTVVGRRDALGQPSASPRRTCAAYSAALAALSMTGSGSGEPAWRRHLVLASSHHSFLHPLRPRFLTSGDSTPLHNDNFCLAAAVGSQGYDCRVGGGSLSCSPQPPALSRGGRSSASSASSSPSSALPVSAAAASSLELPPASARPPAAAAVAVRGPGGDGGGGGGGGSSSGTPGQHVSSFAEPAAAAASPAGNGGGADDEVLT